MLRACDWWSVAGSPASDDQPMGGDPSASAATVLTQFSERQRGQALDRCGMLRAHVEDKVPLAEIARQHKLPLRTLERWMRGYREHGLAGLVRKPRSNRGQHQLPQELQHLIEGLALRRPRLSAAAVCRQAVEVANVQNWPAPSYSTVFTIVRGLAPDLVTLAHQGTKVYADRFELLYRREASRPNEMWQADHTPLDLWVLDERSRPARPWLTIVLDDYSRAVAGFTLSLHAPSSIQTALALRQARRPGTAAGNLAQRRPALDGMWHS